MTMLRISQDQELPIEAVTKKLAFLGMTGTGKTYAATKCAELMLDVGAQVIALDHVGKWQGLRQPGLGPAFSIPVFGGLDGDLPLEPTSGALVAEVIAESGSSAVLDVSQMIKAEQTRFSYDFATHFFQHKKAAPSAVHLFLEECQEVLPENPDPGERMCLSAWTRIAKLGRNFGIGLSLISQRPQEIAKKALNLCEVLFVFQLSGPQERKAIKAYMTAQGLDPDVVDVLPTLGEGDCFLWSPSWLRTSKRLRFLPKRTADVSSTPKVGAGAQATRALTPIDIESLRERMAAAEPEDPKATDDVKALRKRVAELEAKLRERPATGLTVEERNAICQLLETMDAVAERWESLCTPARALGHAALRLEAAPNAPVRPALPVERHVDVRLSPALNRAPKETLREKATRLSATAAAHDTTLKAGARRMLQTLARVSARLTRKQLATLSGMKVSGTFSGYLSALRTQDLIAEPDSATVEITARGRTHAKSLGLVSTPLSSDEVLAMWRGTLKLGARRMLDVGLQLGPERWISKTDLASRVDMEESGTFFGYISALKSNGLFEVERQRVRLSPTIFLGARTS